MGDRKIKFLLIISVLVTASSAAFPQKTSSAVFPITGNVYPDGLYYVSMFIGNPAKLYYLDIDTGSDLTWLQCNAPCVSCPKTPHDYYLPKKQDLVLCGNELCAAVQRSTGDKHPCNSPSAQCHYEIDYADGSSSLGVLINDMFPLRLTNYSSFRPHLTFGCGYNQQGKGATSPTDGIIGLGKGKSSILSQLREQGLTKSMIGHCLGSRGGGYLYFGDNPVPRTGVVTWAPMSQSTLGEKYYSPGEANLYLGKQSLTGTALPVVLDSGSSYTYFPNQLYGVFLSRLKNALINTPIKEPVADPALSVCWKVPKPFKSVADVKKYFPPLILNFMNGAKATLMGIPAENYLIITKDGNVCLGILNGKEVKLNEFILIGDISMQDVMVIYDNENKQIGWVRAICDKRPKTGTSHL